MSTQVKKARPGDRPAIEALCRRAHRAIPRLWWWEEHLGHTSFVVVEDAGTVVGALLAWPDESPVAWVRLAALDDALEVGEWLILALPPVLDGLRYMGTQSLAWMDYEGWAGLHLSARGFHRLDEVMTLIKMAPTLPDLDITDTHIRPASDADVPAIVAVDRAAFTPHWWHSETTLHRRLATSPYFTVAERAGKVVGYAEAAYHLPAAHLNRIAVHPHHQHCGVGAALLTDALCAFWQSGADKVTLNTQASNRPSQRLYRRFGFEPTGDFVTVWELHL